MEKDESKLIKLEADETQGSQKKQPEEKKKKDCRDNCMHCGAHCIYLKKAYREEEK